MFIYSEENLLYNTIQPLTKPIWQPPFSKPSEHMKVSNKVRETSRLYDQWQVLLKVPGIRTPNDNIPPKPNAPSFPPREIVCDIFEGHRRRRWLMFIVTSCFSLRETPCRNDCTLDITVHRTLSCSCILCFFCYEGPEAGTCCCGGCGWLLWKANSSSRRLI